MSKRLLSSRKSLLVLAFAALAMWLADAMTDAEAQRTRRGGGSYGGSITELTIQFLDQNAFVTRLGSTCADLEEDFEAEFFDLTIQPFNQNNTVPCTFDGTPATCTVNMTCSCFRKGVCGQNERRISSMECPTVPEEENGNGEVNLAGCEGDILVEPVGLPAFTLPVGGIENLTTGNDCEMAFPVNTDLPLGVREIGQITQICNDSEPEDESIVDDRLRGFSGTLATTLTYHIPSVIPEANFTEQTQGAEVIDDDATTCQPPKVNVKGCPKKRGDLWIRVDGAALAALEFDPNDAVAEPSTVQCGENGPPRRCRAHRDLNGDSIPELECRCPICDPVTGAPLNNQVLYVLNQTTFDPSWSAGCSITVKE